MIKMDDSNLNIIPNNSVIKSKYEANKIISNVYDDNYRQLSSKSTFSKFNKILPLYPSIHIEELTSALNDLDSLIGLYKVKEAVIGQLAYALMLLDNPQLNKNKYMLHTLIVGPPGVGKSNLAYILGRIWAALGIVGKKEMERKDFTKDQEMIFHLSRNLDFINNKAQLIKLSLTRESLESKLDHDDNTIEERLDWIIKLSQESSNDADYIKKLLTDGKKPIKFKKVTRADLVGQWQGHTAERTRKILNEALGGVLFIDEAYQLVTTHDDSGDNFGLECLTTINEFMSEHCGEIIIIFAGYEDTMDETIFRIQPGLKRRFMWRFNIEPYSSLELSQIINKQAIDDGWKFDEKITPEWIYKLVSNNIDWFPNYGGDTSRLIFYSAIEHACQRITNPNLKKGVLTKKMIKQGLKYLKQNSSKGGDPPFSMYI
jgi:adenylate kinase family enzyme